MALPKISTWALFFDQVHINLFVCKILEHFLAIKQHFRWPRWKHTQATRTAAAQHSTAQLSPPSSQHSTQLQQKAAWCRLNPEQARFSIIAQRCCTLRTAHELAHLSCVAQAFKTCADELRRIAQPLKTCVARVAPIAYSGPNEVAHVAPAAH